MIAFDRSGVRATSAAPSVLGVLLGITPMLVCGLACTDETLDLREALETGPNTTSNGGNGGETTQGAGGSANGPPGEDALEAQVFCEDGVGECFLETGELRCTGRVSGTALTMTSGEQARLVVDMTRALELRLAFRVCDPTGYALNIGDSLSNNGGGGDWGDVENDAEVQLYATDISAFSSDRGYEQKADGTGHHPLLFTQGAGYVSARGCSVRTLHLRDQYIADPHHPNIRGGGPHALRINPAEDSQGPSDALWYIGVNRVVSNSLRDRSRTGSGVQVLRLCFAVPPPEPPPRTGP